MTPLTFDLQWNEEKTINVKRKQKTNIRDGWTDKLKLAKAIVKVILMGI